MNCLAHIVKYILYVFNLLFLVCGILLITFGAITLTSISGISDFKEATSTNTLPILILILGCLVFIVSFLGCCGAIKDGTCLLTSYCICLLILFILQIALIIYTWVARNSFLDSMGNIVDSAWKLEPDQPSYMDGLQLGFKCCGRVGSQDYLTLGRIIPNSCCGSMTEACSNVVASTKPGCRQEFINFWAANTNIIKFAGLGIAAVELLALIFGWFLVSSIKTGKTV